MTDDDLLTVQWIADDDKPGQPYPIITTSDGMDILLVYFERRRDALIAELRAIDKLLGRQTIPDRVR